MKKQKTTADFEAALSRLRAAVREEERDWQEAEWRAVLRQAIARGSEKPPERMFTKRRMLWASAAGLLLVGFAAAYFLGLRREPVATISESAAGIAEHTDRGQETITLTLISQESGLRVYWCLNRNFHWEGEE